MRGLEQHHIVWLANHPDRSEEWLKAILKQGFEVHHVDGDHDNNSPRNLILMERNDHRELHGFFRLTGIKFDTVANARKGGYARAAKLSQARRSRIARDAANARWSRSSNAGV